MALQKHYVERGRVRERHGATHLPAGLQPLLLLPRLRALAALGRLEDLALVKAREELPVARASHTYIYI